MSLLVPYDPRVGEQGPIRFREDLRTQSFSFSGNSFVFRRSFQCKWTDRFRFVQAMLGSVIIEGKDTVTPRLERFVPSGFEGYPDVRPTNGARSILYPLGVESIEGLGPRRTDSVNRYKDPNLFVRARTTFSYDAPTYPVRLDTECPTFQARRKAVPGFQQINPVFVGVTARSEWRRYTTKIVQPHTEAVRLPVGYFKWTEGLQVDNQVVSPPQDVPVNIGTFRLMPSQEVTYIFHQVPALLQPWEGRLTGDGNTSSDSNGQAQWLYQEPAPTGAGVMPELLGSAFTHIGCVNARWFDGYPPGTLLLTAIEARPYKWVTGERYYDYTYRMKFFNPPDVLPLNGVVLAMDGNTAMPSRQGSVASYIGHNYFLRFTPPSPAGGTIVVEPFYCLITHDGKRIEEGGQPVFMYRDFEDLFIPYNRAHMTRFYQKVTLYPRWDQA